MRIEALTAEIEAIARWDVHCQRTMSVPGLGPIISSAMVAAIGTGEGFYKGRDFAACCGIVPKQVSTGDRTILGSVSKRGNKYLRKLVVQRALATGLSLAKALEAKATIVTVTEPRTNLIPDPAVVASVESSDPSVAIKACLNMTGNPPRDLEATIPCGRAQ